jgi:hypothetical protein
MEKVEFLSALGINKATFTGFLNREQFALIATKAHEVRAKNSSDKQLANIEDMSTLTKEVQEWINEVWFPQAIKTGLRYLAFVVPKSTLAKMSMKAANQPATEKFPIEIKYFDSESQALEWLTSIQ